jgi:osmotically-inducible protein OsmY
MLHGIAAEASDRVQRQAQRIRHALTQDKELSTYAHNVKVVAQGGEVTLKGPVRSEEEKKNVESKAVEVAGSGHVINQLSVAPDSSAGAKPASTKKTARTKK